MGFLGTVAAVLPAAHPWPPPLTDDTLPVLWSWTSLPQVWDLRQMDCLTFLRRTLLASRPAGIVDTLLVKYHHSSAWQQQVAWTAFQWWLPQTNNTVSREDALCFLHYLFSDKGLAPCTIVNYWTALQWPLEEPFQIDFSHPDFSRLATGFFHLRLLVPPTVPQWNLSAVVRFYEQVDHDTCSPSLLLNSHHGFHRYRFYI